MITTQDILNVMTAKKLNVFTNDSKNFNLNLIGIRSKNVISNAFNDWLRVLWFGPGQTMWSDLAFRIPAIPGKAWLFKPPSIRGVLLCKKAGTLVYGSSTTSVV